MIKEFYSGFGIIGVELRKSSKTTMTVINHDDDNFKAGGQAGRHDSRSIFNFTDLLTERYPVCYSSSEGKKLKKKLSCK